RCGVVPLVEIDAMVRDFDVAMTRPGGSVRREGRVEDLARFAKIPVAERIAWIYEIRLGLRRGGQADAFKRIGGRRLGVWGACDGEHDRPHPCRDERPLDPIKPARRLNEVEGGGLFERVHAVAP